MTFDEIAATALGSAHKGKSPEAIAKLAHCLAKAICKEDGHQGTPQGGSLWFCRRCKVQYFLLDKPLRKAKGRKK